MRRISCCLIAVVVLGLMNFQPTTRAQELVSADPVSRQLLSAESTGPHTFATIVDDNAVGIVAWTDPANAGASDDARAEAVLRGYEVSHYLKATGPGFSIPTGATIVGIKVEVEARVSVGIGNGFVRLVKGGTIVGSQVEQGLSGASDATYTFGGATSLWDTTWTPAQVNAADFGATLYVSALSAAQTIGVDHIKITVYYLPYRLLLPLVSR